MFLFNFLSLFSFHHEGAAARLPSTTAEGLHLGETCHSGDEERADAEEVTETAGAAEAEAVAEAGVLVVLAMVVGLYPL